jgi:hypothetical protein
MRFVAIILLLTISAGCDSDNTLKCEACNGTVAVKQVEHPESGKQAHLCEECFEKLAGAEAARQALVDDLFANVARKMSDPAYRREAFLADIDSLVALRNEMIAEYTAIGERLAPNPWALCEIYSRQALEEWKAKQTERDESVLNEYRDKFLKHAFLLAYARAVHSLPVADQIHILLTVKEPDAKASQLVLRIEVAAGKTIREYDTPENFAKFERCRAFVD